ncbi:MAG TPA: carboxypeptidase-like regulatory domain-containing protein [Bryobacteraceae bacterium]|nr:carboxypeptidase-like regulatory domain-containing protein [Bryobacteraceae bacterium]
MRSRSPVRILLLVGLLAGGAQAAGYRVSGVVVNAATQAPVAGARITIAPIERREERLPFVTGQDGRFLFAGIPQGKYELMAQRRGFLTAIYGARPNLSMALVTGPGRNTDSLVLPLSPPAIISGRVMDDGGDPIGQANVQLLSATIESGRRRLATAAIKTTDDTGEYRFAGLPAGSYYLAASGYPWYAKFNQTHGDSHSLSHLGYGIRYYPNVSDPAAAAPILLKAGEDANADFALPTVPAVTVAVAVERSEDIEKQFTLTAAGLPGNQVLLRRGTEAGDQYAFWGVPPGHYTVRVQSSDSTHSWYARQPVDVGATDTEVSVTLLDASSLTGTVALEGGGHLPDSLSVLLHDAEDSGIQSAPVGAGGRFSIPAMLPQHCRVTLKGPDEYYLRGWSVAGARRQGDTLDIPGAAAVRLQLFAAQATGRIDGTVAQDGHAIPGALVVLADQSKPENSRAVQSDSDGSYEFRGLPPGSYALFAVPDGADLEYADPAAIRPYLGSARKVRVSAGGAYTAHLELPAPTAGRPGAASPAP